MGREEENLVTAIDRGFGDLCFHGLNLLWCWEREREVRMDWEGRSWRERVDTWRNGICRGVEVSYNKNTG